MHPKIYVTNPCGPGKSLTKEFRWDVEGRNVVTGSHNDVLTVWLEQDGQEVSGTKQTLTNGPWIVAWNGLEPEPYDIVFTYFNHKGEPSQGSGRETVDLFGRDSPVVVVNVLGQAEPKGKLGQFIDWCNLVWRRLTRSW